MLHYYRCPENSIKTNRIGVVMSYLKIVARIILLWSVGYHVHAQGIDPVRCGDGTVPGLPADVIFPSNGTWLIGQGGHAVGRGILQGASVVPATSDGMVLVSPAGVSALVLRSGMIIDGKTVTSIGAAYGVAADGTVVAVGYENANSQNPFILTGTPGAMKVAAGNGIPLAGLPAGGAAQFFGMNAAGEYAFALAGAIYRGNASADTAPVRVVGNGDTVLGLNDGTVITSVSEPLLNNNGMMAFQCSLSGTNTSGRAICTFGEAGAPEFLVAEMDGTLVPAGLGYDRIFLHSISDSGLVMYEARVTGAGVTFANAQCYWSQRVNEAQVLLARAGDALPNQASALSIFNVFLTESGEAVVRGGAGSNGGLWRTSGSGYTPVAVRGDAIPGMPGEVFGSVFTADVSADGRIAFSSPTQNFDDRIFVTNGSGTPELLLSAGDILTIDGQPATAQSPSLVAASYGNNNGGARGTFNNTGKIIIRYNFSCLVTMDGPPPLGGVDLEGEVLIDPDGDGLDLDASEGLDAITIELVVVDENGIPIGGQGVTTNMTDGNGDFGFSGAAAPYYAVRATLDPIRLGQNFYFTTPTPNDPSISEFFFEASDPAPVTFLVARRVNVNGIVRDDDNGGAGLAGAEIRLLKASDETQVGPTITTSADGLFMFPLVEPGDYLLRETDPATYTSVSDTGPGNSPVNEIPITVVSSNDSTGHEFVDRLADFNVSLRRLDQFTVQQRPIIIINTPILPVTNTAALASTPLVSDGFVADDVTPLLIKIASPGIVETTTVYWTSTALSGGTLDLEGNRTRFRKLVDGNWVDAGSLFGSVVLTPEEPCAYLYHVALAPEELDFDEGSTQITRTFSLWADANATMKLTDLVYGIRRLPLIIMKAAGAPPWSAPFLAELQTVRPEDFIIEARSGQITSVYLADLQESMNNAWALTRFDFVTHGLQYADVTFYFGERYLLSQAHLGRGFMRRCIMIDAPLSGTLLSPFLSELDKRLRAQANPTADFLFGFIGETALAIPTWDFIQRNGNRFNHDWAFRTGNPEEINFLALGKSGDIAKVHFITTEIHGVASNISIPNAAAFNRVGLTGEILDRVFPLGSDGVVGVESMTGRTPKTLAKPRDIRVTVITSEEINHAGPNHLFGNSKSVTESISVAQTITGLLDSPESQNVFRPYLRPEAYSAFEIEGAKSAARDVPAANVVDIVRVNNLRRRAIQSFTFDLTVPVSQPIVGDVYWLAEAYGTNGVTTAGLNVIPAGGNPGRVTIDVDDAVVLGDVVLFASYQTTGGKTAFAYPIRVTTIEPSGATAQSLELAPDGVTLPEGETIVPDYNVIYSDGSRIRRYVESNDVTSVVSSDPGVVDVSTLPNWQLVGEGTATVTVNAFGLSDTVTISVTNIFPTQTFAAWKADRYTSPELANAAITGDDVDLEGDFKGVLVEYITAGEPDIPEPEHAPVMMRDADGFLYFARVSSSIEGETVEIQYSGDLGGWQTLLEIDGEPDLSNPIIEDYTDFGEYYELTLNVGTSLVSEVEFFRLIANP